MQHEMLSDTEVAAILGLSVWTLRSWRCKGRGPQFIRVSNRCKYFARALSQYVRGLPTGGGAVVAAGGEEASK
jgi:predicted site-specific integrase-resolvase